MPIEWNFHHSKARWCATILVAAVLVSIFYRYTKEFAPASFRFTPFDFVPREQRLEDGYLVVYEHKLNSAERIALGRQMGMDVVQMPRLGIAYFDKEVPQRVVDKIVSEFERDTSIRSHRHWRFYVSRNVNWVKFSGLIAASILIAIALVQFLIYFQSIVTRLMGRTR